LGEDFEIISRGEVAGIEPKEDSEPEQEEESEVE
jgi:hypothetical protein